MSTTKINKPNPFAVQANNFAKKKDMFLSTTDEEYISGYITRFYPDDHKKRKDGSWNRTCQIEVESGKTLSSTIMAKGIFSKDILEKVPSKTHLYFFKGYFDTKKGRDRLIFNIEEITTTLQEDLLSQNQNSLNTNPQKYTSFILQPFYHHETMILSNKSYVRPFAENVKGVGESFVSQIAQGYSLVDFLANIARRKNDDLVQFFLKDKATSNRIEKLQAIHKYVVAQLNTVPEELMFLMRICKFDITKRQKISKLKIRKQKEILQNPYILLQYFPTVPNFCSSDMMALILGGKATNPERYKALIIALIANVVDQGNVCLKQSTVDHMMSTSDELQRISAFQNSDSNFLSSSQLNSLLDDMVREKLIRITIFNNERYLYLAKDYQWEHFTASNALRRVRKSPENIILSSKHFINGSWKKGKKTTITATDWTQFFKEYEAKSNMQLASKQKEAVQMVFNNNISLLAGRAGYGKTATTAALVSAIRFFVREDYLQTQRERGDFPSDDNLIKLAGSTGRAAQQMMISLNKGKTQQIQASTIHSLYKIMPKSKSLGSHVNAKFVIIDESSMIDLPLLYHILKLTDSKTHLLFIGDPNQLPSVGIGRVYHDMIDSKVIPLTTLDHLFRTGAGSIIALNSSRILDGHTIQAHEIGANEVQKDSLTDGSIWIKADSNEEIRKVILQVVKKKLAQGLKISDFAIMSPTHGTIAGVDQMNISLQNLINPANGRKAVDGFLPGDRVMQIKNDWSMGVINGDKGYVKDVDPVNNLIHVVMDQYPHKVFTYSTNTYAISKRGKRYMTGSGSDQNLRLAYIFTVHKMQGDSGNCCICLISKSMYYFLDRTLLYTAATRAVNQMIFVGEKKYFSWAIHKVKDRSRTSLLKARLQNSVHNM